jgi:hypothetical protein
MAKIKKEELENLQALVQKVNELQLQIGGVEVQKHEFLHMMGALRSQLDTLQSKLQEDYGDVKVDIKTGEIQPNEPSKED